MCDKSEILASPLMTINEKDFERCISAVAEQAKLNRAELIVVGNPINMNGTEGPRSEKCKAFAALLSEMTGIPVELYTPLFAVARVAGWSAHRVEELIGTSKIIRPAYMSVMERK